MNVFVHGGGQGDFTDALYKALSLTDAAESVRDGLRRLSDLAGEKASAKLVLAFYTIASNPEGIPATECADVVGITLTGMQRIAARLGDLDRTGEPGMQLIDVIRDPSDARRT